MYAPKGEKGDQGVQGVAGPPSLNCACSYRPHVCNKLVRYITSGGSRTLTSTDTLIIVNSIKSCKLVLPELVVPHVDSKDHYYYPVIIQIMNEAGIHEVVAESGRSINEYYAKIVLDKRKVHTFLSTPQGQWLSY